MGAPVCEALVDSADGNPGWNAGGKDRRHAALRRAFCPLLANMFLHYAFDRWVSENLPGVPFCRYADDVVCCIAKAKRRLSWW